MHRRSNPNPSPGDSLRDQAADLLSSQYGEAKREFREEGKKSDVYFEHKDLGRTVKIYVEAKDYEKPLRRSEAVQIKSDYEGILRKNAPAILLIVTRTGLTADAQSYIDREIENTRHQTIWQIETGLIDLDGYLRHLIDEYTGSGLSRFYINNGFSVRAPLSKEHEIHVHNTKSSFNSNKSCFEAVSEWIYRNDDNRPVAILGGYGTGKTSLSIRLAAYLAEKSLYDPNERQPIILKLGGISQYANIEGLLAGYFTNTFPIRNFNFHNFLSLNKKGRFVIILDGFDEMKHSMTWSDFKSQVKSLLLLNCEKSKVILLGRPSAFLSETEERYILKGERPFGDSWVTLPDWPRFHELEISNFTDSEREAFISQYLMSTTQELDHRKTTARAVLANEIASQDADLYKKPVHSKILTDLARDPNFDLEQFKSSSSRWLLYQEFMSSLYEREADKRTRSDISTKRRISFLGDLAFWLWTDKNASISFRVSDIPRSLYGNIATEEDDDILPLCRELLVGSILERKSGDTFFFGHRSFAEFIVADSLLSKNPTAKDHEKYSAVFQDGVREFLLDSRRTVKIKQWSSSFGLATGKISQTYIEFLAEAHGGIEALVKFLPDNSHWKKILLPFDGSLIPNKVNYHRVFSSLFKSESLAFAWQYCWLTQLDGEGWRNAAGVQGLGATAFDRQITVCLINSLFSSLSNNDRTLFVDVSHVGLRRICYEAVKIFDFEGRAEFEWSHQHLGEACLRELKRNGLEWQSELVWKDRRFSTNTDEIFKRLSQEAQDNLLIYLRHVRSWASITERSNSKGQRREVNRSIKGQGRGKSFRAPKLRH